jgi:8-oxo-dGTP pyrophosphatase MutT (NUDIX family)
MEFAVWNRTKKISMPNDTADIPEFGIKRPNEERRDGGCAVVYDPQTKLFAIGRDLENGLYRLFSGGVDDDEDIQQGVLREVVEESGLHEFKHVEKIVEMMCHYYNSLKKVNRVAKATCYLVVLKSKDLVPVHLEPHEHFVLDWKTSDEIIKNWEERNLNHDVDHWIYTINKSIERLRELGYKNI